MRKSKRSVTKTVVKRSTQISWVLGYGRERDGQCGRIHGFKYVFLIAFLFSFNFFGRIFSVLWEWSKISIESSSVGVSVLPFLLVFAYFILGLQEISLSYYIFTVLLIS